MATIILAISEFNRFGNRQGDTIRRCAHEYQATVPSQSSRILGKNKSKGLFFPLKSKTNPRRYLILLVESGLVHLGLQVSDFYISLADMRVQDPHRSDSYYSCV